MMSWLPPSISALLGLWAGLLAHRGWGNYHDGVRPLMAEQAEGALPRSELAALARDSNRPFVAGTLALSAIAGVPLAHWAWLPAEYLGFRSRRAWQAMLAGALWGLAAWGSIRLMRLGAGALPVSLIPGWERAGTVALLSVLFAPALGAGHRFGLRRGLGVLVLAAAGAGVGVAVGGGAPAGLPAGVAAVLAGPSAGIPAGVGAVLAGLAGFLALVVADALRNRGVREEMPAVPRRVPLWAMVIQGALLAVAVRSGTFGWSNADAVAAGRAWWGVGAAVAAILAPAFAPQWSAALTSTGVMQLAGLGTGVVAGYLAPSPLWAAPLGALTVFLELRLLPVAARLPELREAGESLRWAFGKMAQAGVLAGSVWGAAELLPGGLGPAAVIAFMVLNELLPHPVWNTAAPAWGLLLTGLMANILRMAGGW